MKWSCPECGDAMKGPFWPEAEIDAWCAKCRDQWQLHEYKRDLWRALGLDKSDEPNYASKDLLPVLVTVVRRLLEKEIARQRDDVDVAETYVQSKVQRQEDKAA